MARLHALTLITGVAVLAGCASPAPVPAPTPSSDVSITPHAGSNLVSLLELLPAPEGNVVITWGDLDAASELAGVERPADGDIDALLEWAMTVMGNDSAQAGLVLPGVLGVNELTRHDEVADELGVSLWSATGFIELSAAPLHVTTVLGGLDTSTLDAVAGEPVDGIWSIGEGEDFAANLESRTAARPLGRPLHVGALDEGAVTYSTAIEPLRALLSGGPTTAADDPDLLAIAEALAEDDPYTGMIFRGTFGGTATGMPAEFTSLALALAAGDGDTSRVLAVYVHDDENAAAENAQAIQAVLEASPAARVLTRASAVAQGTLMVAEFELGDVPIGAVWSLPYDRTPVFSFR